MIPLVIGMLLAGFLCADAQTWSWSEDNLPYYARDGLSATVLDDCIYYSGGRLEPGVFYNIIEIYDVGEDSWSLAEAEGADRWQTTAVSANGMVFFAGGNDYNGTGSFNWYADIDVYNKDENEWTVKYLSEPRILFGDAVAYGNKVFFAGGLSILGGNYIYHDRVDIYDTENDTMETKYLSVPRCMIGATALGGKVFFAGGNNGPNEVTNVVDVYDIVTGEWADTINLSIPRAFTSAVTYGDRVYFAGGTLPDYAGCDVIDIYNVVNGQWEDSEELSEPMIVSAYNVYNSLVFTGWCDYFEFDNGSAGNLLGTVNIFYPGSGQWDYSVSDLDPVRHWFAHTSYDNRVYYAGGRLGGGGEMIKTINILDKETDISNNKYQELGVNVHPNPFSTTIRIDYNLQHSCKVNLAIYNNIGKQVEILFNEYQQQGEQQVIINTEKLKSGIYFCVLRTNNGIQFTKMIKL